jgi:hypothetical protein
MIGKFRKLFSIFNETNYIATTYDFAPNYTGLLKEKIGNLIKKTSLLTVKPLKSENLSKNPNPEFRKKSLKSK